MKRAKSELNDWGRPEYKRSDFGEFVGGKYAKRVRESSNVVILEPEVAKAYPNNEAVNNALRSLMSTKRSVPDRSVKRKKKATSGKSRAA